MVCKDALKLYESRFYLVLYSALVMVRVFTPWTLAKAYKK